MKVTTSKSPFELVVRCDNSSIDKVIVISSNYVPTIGARFELTENETEQLSLVSLNGKLTGTYVWVSSVEYKRVETKKDGIHDSVIVVLTRFKVKY